MIESPGTIDALFASPASLITARLRAAYDDIQDAALKPIILFGCGALGQRTASALRASGHKIHAFVDNNRDRWGHQINGVSVLCPVDAIGHYGNNAIFVVCIYNGSQARAQLKALGARHILHIRDFYHAFSKVLLPWCALDLPEIILDSKNEIQSTLSCWADERSRGEFISQLRWHLGISTPLAPHDPPELCYFEPDLISLDATTYMADCGAFDGDSLKAFLIKNKNFRAYRGFEPDPLNFAKLHDYTKRLPASIMSRIHIENCALGSETGNVRFSSGAGVASSCAEDGDLNVPLRTLDEFFMDAHPTLIKMDIEGAELDALKGATCIMQKSRPTLAISSYHHVSDLWKIPALIHEIEPSYSLHLRRYAEDCWETIIYAIPEHGAQA